MGVVVAVVAAVVVVAVVLVVVARSRGGESGAASLEAPAELTVPVAEFHVKGEDAQVFFDVPLPDGGADEVLADLLVGEAIEVVREKRHHLPIAGVLRVVAFGKERGEWREVGAVGLETPGELPPPVAPTLLPQSEAPDPLERIADLPQQAPGIEARTSADTLPALADELRLPATLLAGLRARGIDPADAGAGDVVLGIMRLTGYMVTGRGDTHTATKGGSTVFLRVVDHQRGEHPELSEGEMRRAVVDFVGSGADRGLVVTEKYGPFEVYDRERRDPRLRFVTRERLQHFVDLLALG
jgi:hypothetical protein